MLTFGASFAGNVAGEIGGIGQGVYNAVAHPINTYNGIVNNVADLKT